MKTDGALLAVILMILAGSPAIARTSQTAGYNAKLGAHENGTRQFVLVLLEEGSGQASREKAQSASRGQFADINKLAAGKKSVAPGPTNKNFQQLAGAFVLSTDHLDTAREWLADDGASAAKLVEPESDLSYGRAAVGEIADRRRKVAKKLIP